MTARYPPGNRLQGRRRTGTPVRGEGHRVGALTSLGQVLTAVRSCRVCEAHLPLGARPLIQAGAEARILVVGQAPGLRAHASGIPWDDPSGDRLRAWMGVERGVFHDPSQIAIIPMGFCYPGRGSDGDLPPRRECAELWLDLLLARLPRIELTLLIGQHAQRHFLGRRRKPSLAGTVRAWEEYAPGQIPLPHPSPRNQPWFKRHPWFERQLVPVLRERVGALVRPWVWSPQSSRLTRSREDTKELLLTRRARTARKKTWGGARGGFV